MASMVIQRLQSKAMTSMTTISSLPGSDAPRATKPENIEEYNAVLLAIYVVVLLGGTINLSLMMHIMKSCTISITSIAVLNIIFAHFIFLLTVPFRIYYYATSDWRLGPDWCKAVSCMIHIHMYMSFIFYVIIVITHLMTFYRKAEREATFQKMRALLLCVVVWTLVIVVGPVIINTSYGKIAKEKTLDGNNSTAVATDCFMFGGHIGPTGKVLNYIISTVIIIVATVLAVLQGNVLRVLHRKHRQGCTSQPDFWAQLKSMCFALIMVVCFIPYHVFRLYYLEHIDLQNINEVFLSLTTFNCLDMLPFLSRRICYTCFRGRAL